jgi:hypothetical protein
MTVGAYCNTNAKKQKHGHRQQVKPAETFNNVSLNLGKQLLGGVRERGAKYNKGKNQQCRSEKYRRINVRQDPVYYIISRFRQNTACKE